MHPLLLLALQGASLLANPAPTDSVFWLPLYYDGYYSFPNGVPAWSPDDEQLVVSYFEYMPPQYFQTNLHILQRDGTWRQCPLENFTFGGAGWSPLGGEIAANDVDKIVVLDPDDCGYIREIGGGGTPRWSTDGQRVVFSVGPDYDATIYVAAAAGGNVQPIVEDGIQPDWSPDGTSIVFVRAGNLWTSADDGTNGHQITESGKDAWPTWSRDGNWIAFTRSDPDRWHTSVWLVGAHGGPAAQVTPSVDGEQRARPSWSWDGTRLTYFVMDYVDFRIGIGIMHDAIPLAVMPRSWGEVKKAFR